VQNKKLKIKLKIKKITIPIHVELIVNKCMVKSLLLLVSFNFKIKDSLKKKPYAAWIQHVSLSLFLSFNKLRIIYY
jgi:hypothetical protein